MRCRFCTFAPALAVVGAVLLAFAGPASAAGNPLDPICGIVKPLDQLLGCPQQPAPRGSSAGSQTAPASSSGSPETAPAPRYVPDRLLVRVKRRAPRKAVATLFARAEVAPVQTIPAIGVRVLRVRPARRERALSILLSSRWVADAEKDVVVEALDRTPNDEYWSDQWGLRIVRLPAAWERARGSRKIPVAVLDTGVAANHVDLKGIFRRGRDLVNRRPYAADDQGHGTAVAGVIAARTNNGKGEAGVCWSCSVIPLKILNAKGKGDLALVALGIVRAVDAGARVINMSLGSPVATEVLARAVAYAARKGVILVAAAGNNSSAAPFYPAAYPEVIGVAASDPSDHLYPWSNYGAWVQVAAPGCNVAPLRRGGFGEFCGTSSAAPIVAGLAALALSARPTATKGEIEQAIERSAVRIGRGVLAGRVDAARTLAMLGVTARTAGHLSARSTATFTGTVSRSSPVRVFRRAVGAGPVAATLRFARARMLALSIVSSRVRQVAHVAGASPLRVVVTLRAGTYRFVVRGRVAPTAFTLVVSHALLQRRAHR